MIPDILSGFAGDAASRTGIAETAKGTLAHHASKSKIWKLAGMDADHAVAWSKGSGTNIKNCQMLFWTHYRAKGNR